MFDDATEITVKEVEKVLSEIENKYSPVRNIRMNPNEFEESVAVLSKEFDSIGVAAIDLSQPFPKMLKELVSSARCLVQIHRRTIGQMKDTNITCQSKNVKNNYLHKIVEECQSKIHSSENKNATLQNRIEVLEEKISNQNKKEADLKNEMEKIKRYHIEQKSDLLRKIKKLSDENKKLKQAGSEVLHHSKDEILLKFVNKYKRNEEIYKTTISKLEENNRQLINEIIDMRCQENPSSN